MAKKAAPAAKANKKATTKEKVVKSKVEAKPKIKTETKGKTDKAAPKVALSAEVKSKVKLEKLEKPEITQDVVKEKPAKAPKAEKPVALTEDQQKWIDYREKFQKEKAQTYNMKAIFEAGKPIEHKVLGWGWIVSVENDRLEVLFESGRKMLISNYNPK